MEERLEVGRTLAGALGAGEGRADLAAVARGGRFSQPWPGEEGVV